MSVYSNKTNELVSLARVEIHFRHIFIGRYVMIGKGTCLFWKISNEVRFLLIFARIWSDFGQIFGQKWSDSRSDFPKFWSDYHIDNTGRRSTGSLGVWGLGV